MGRYKGIPEEKQFACFCDLEVADDEFHFIFYCLPYAELRTLLFCFLSDADMLSWLFNVKAFVVARFIEDAWQLRQSTLYPIRQF